MVFEVDTQDTQEDADTRRRYTFFVDGAPYHVEQPTITGREIMDLAHIPHDVGLLLIEEDGSQRSVGLDEVIDLQRGPRMRRPPRFKRG